MKYYLRQIVIGLTGEQVVLIQCILNGKIWHEAYEDLDGNEYDWDAAVAFKE